jgi:hypothetical protein
MSYEQGGRQMSDDVLRWFYYWLRKAEQWRAVFYEPKYTKVMLLPNDTMESTHFAFKLAGVIGYVQQDNYNSIILKKRALQWAADTGERVVVFMVHPQTKGVQVLEGAEVMAMVNPETFQDKEEQVLVLDVSGVQRGALGQFFQSINSWKGDWMARREKRVDLWRAHEKRSDK